MRPSRGALFFLILVLTTSVILLVEAQYGEESTSLGQFVDEFTDLNNVSVRVLIERNATLNAMELNSTLRTQKAENFTDYTEVDVNNDITVYDFNITWDTMRRDADSYVYVDRGAGNLGDFEFEFELNITALEAGDITGQTVTGLTVLANMIASVDSIITANKPFLGMQIAQKNLLDDQYWIYIWEEDLTGNNKFVLRLQDIGGDYLFFDDIEYYFTFNRSGNDVGGYAYSDQARTNLLASREAVGDGNSFRYLYPLNNWGGAVDGADHHSGYMENLFTGNVSGGYATQGHFTTEDYLDQVNGSTLVQMTNATIPAGTTLSVSFSSDNSTWINQTALTDGFMSIDLRTLNLTSSYFLNYTFTGTLSATPRLYQSRLITTEGVPERVNVSSEWTYFNVTELNVTIGTVDAGNITSLYFMDRNRLNVSETVGVPAMEVEFNFTGIPTDARCVWLVMNTFYDGSASHEFCVQVWNLTSSAWVTIDVIPDQTGFEWTNATIYDLRIPNDYLDGSGKIIARLCHTSAGNINHDLSVNLIQIYVELPSTVTPSVAGDVDIGPWIAIAIILSIIAYLLARSR